MKLTLDSFEQQIGQLPSLSPVISRLLDLLQSDGLNITTLSVEIQKDPALTARILRIANSSFYGLSSQVYDIRHACALLGLHTVHGIVMRVEVIHKFPTTHLDDFDQRSFWQHANSTGIAAEVLASRSNLDTKLAFIAGLLHDLGKLVLAVYFKKDFERVSVWRDQHDCLFYEAEQAVLGFNHSEIGARMAEYWKLPSPLVNSIRYHHTINKDSSSLDYLIHIADIISRGLGIGNSCDDLIPILNSSALTMLALDWQDIKDSLSQIKQLSDNSDSF